MVLTFCVRDERERERESICGISMQRLLLNKLFKISEIK